MSYNARLRDGTFFAADSSSWTCCVSSDFVLSEVKRRTSGGSHLRYSVLGIFSWLCQECQFSEDI